MVYAVMDACGDDIELSKEAMIFIMRVTNTPQSQIDQVYFEEVGMTGKEASKLTPEQLAKRYAEYKVKRGTMLIPSGFVSQKLYDSREQYAYQQIKERYSKRENPDIVEKYMELDKRIDEIGKQKNDAINAISEGKFDGIEKLSVLHRITPEVAGINLKAVLLCKHYGRKPLSASKVADLCAFFNFAAEQKLLLKLQRVRPHNL